MLRVGVVGINHKLADLKLREQLAKTCQRRFGASQSLHADHFVVLSTCNRTEIYFCSEDLADTHTYLLSILRVDVEEEFDHKLYSYFGIDCFIHLAKVTAGLDSAIIAETEIQCQVKIAYESVLEYRILPKELHFLFQKSLGLAKKIRSEFQLGRGMPDLEHAIYQTGRHFFDMQEDMRVLFVGASDINQKILKFLKGKNLSQITLCNRSENNGRKVADLNHVQWLPWQNLKNWHAYDWIIFGTKSPEYLISYRDISVNSTEKKLVMDLCVPRNVDPKLGLDPKVTLLNIDQINRQLRIRHRGLLQAVAEAENRIVETAQQHTLRYAQRGDNKIRLAAHTA